MGLVSVLLSTVLSVRSKVWVYPVADQESLTS